jgi:hypothetical protein
MDRDRVRARADRLATKEDPLATASVTTGQSGKSPALERQRKQTVRICYPSCNKKTSPGLIGH